MFLLNSCLSLFSAAPIKGHPFSRSYGVILPSSLTMLLPSALGFSPHPPVSVFGTGVYRAIAAFLGTWYLLFPTPFRSTSRLLRCAPVFPCAPLLRLCRASPSRLAAPHMRPRSSDGIQYRNLHLLSIGYAFRPRLRPRLTQGRSALPWNPWIFGRKDSHLPLATHSGILPSIQSTAPSGTASSRIQCSPTSAFDCTPRLRCRVSAPDIFGAGPLD